MTTNKKGAKGTNQKKNTKGKSLPVYKMHSCELCDELDSDDMVQCDSCDLWFHFVCVNVTSDVNNQDWSCAKCNQKLIDQSKSVRPPKSYSLMSSKADSYSRQKAIVLQKLDEEQAIKLDILNRKYQVITGVSDEAEYYESSKRSSMDYTLKWAKKVQGIQQDFSKMVLSDNVSVSLSDYDREWVNQQTFDDLKLRKSSRESQHQAMRDVFVQQQQKVESKDPKSRSDTQFGLSSLIDSEFQSHSNLRPEWKSQQYDESLTPNTQQPQMNFRLGSPSASYQLPFMEFDYQGVPSKQHSKARFDVESADVPNASNGEFGFDSRKSSNQFGFGYTNVPNRQPQPQWNKENFDHSSIPINEIQPNVHFGSNQHQPNVHFGSNQHQPNVHFGSNQYQPNVHFGSNQHQPNVHFGLNQHQPNVHFGSNQHQPNVQFGSNQINNPPYQQTVQQSNNQIAAPLVDYFKLCQSGVNLTTSQIAARHTMDRKLIHFYGEPKKWQMFESAFVTATVTCGLNNAENLSRLLNSLKGDALDAVHCRLIHPDSVPGVMNTLRLMYGRPELIIHTLLEDINKTAAPKADDLGSLVKFAISVQNLCATVKTYQAMEHLRNPILMKALTDKLPVQTQLNWAYYKHSVGAVNLSTLGDWLFNLAEIASDVMKPSIVKVPSKKYRKEDSNEKNYVNAHSVETAHGDSKKSSNSTKANFKCRACNSDANHKLDNCKKFKELSTEDRWTIIKKNNMCGGCLGNHRYYRCKSRKKCNVEGCDFYHHVLLHNHRSKERDTNSTQEIVPNTEEKKICNAHKSEKVVSKCLDKFRIVPVILSYKEKSVRIFAYLDDGSNLTSLEFDVAKRIGADGTLEKLCILWSFGDMQIEENSRRVSVRITGVFDGAETYTLHDVRTVKKLGLPTQSITREWLDQYEHFNGIPISTYENATPQMIIGLQYSKLMVSLKTIESDWSRPLVCKTRLGWVVQGPDNINTNSCRTFRLNMCDCQSADNNLHQLVNQFFSIESFGVKIPERLLESKELKRARQILESSTVKKGHQYETALLWRDDNVQLPNSFCMAKKRLQCVELKMKKDPELAVRMCNYLDDFLKKGYIRKLTKVEQQIIGPRTWYMPIFPVFNPKKPEKLRMVWDGAAKVNGISLNSKLLTGPDQLVPLPDILRRFRERKIGITGDIREMFHQVLIRECDQDSQRFLWRDGNSKKEPEVYAMKVMTFGSTCSPCAAQFVKNKNALEFKDEFPIAVNAIINSHYVDDMIESAHTVDEAVKLVQDVKYVHQHAGFELRSFTSNSQEVLQAINGSSQFIHKGLDGKVDFEIERVLGMYWNTEFDTFTYSLKHVKIKDMSQEYNPTKREVLRIVMSVFDPLGFLSHLLIHAKIILQDIWRSNIGWDEKLPISLKNKWTEWIKYLMKVEEVHIPRLYSPRMSPEPAESIQLHMFVDASVEAYAAVAYFRIQNYSGVDSCLIGAKSKVAPNKPMSVPRLELQAAVLGTRFIESLNKSHSGLHIDKKIIWCDSRTVLFWLKSDHRRYKQFVAFRIGEILDSSESIEWRWIPSEYNVADEATKSKRVPDLNSSSRWFVGPEFLREKNPNWYFDLDEPEVQVNDELRPCYLLAHLEIPSPKIIDYKRFSNWQRLLRALAYVLRFIQNIKPDLHQQHGLLSCEELFEAEHTLYRQAQFECFQDEILIIRWNEIAPLNEQKDFEKSSILRTCSPYLDDNNILRVRGRIDAATSVPESAKRPIILSRNHYITYLIVYWYHRKYLHLHHQTVLNEIKQKYWIPKLRVVLNGVRNNCQKCKNTVARSRPPEMASLPLARLAAFTRPWTYTGIDFFGPILVVVNRGTQKRWGVLMTCLTTRAVHLEIAHSLDTSSCIMAIENFGYKQGWPKEFYSDNGTNFHGSDNALRAEFAKLNQDKIQEKFTTADLKWSFNPPLAPHMGGVYERMVRIVKNCLDGVMTVRYPTDEMLKNLFSAVQYIVNSRPLTYISLESPDDEELTPNHFLFGSSNGNKVLGEFTDRDRLRNDWKAAQVMADLFWKKFVKEYIPTLTKRTKWFQRVEPLRVGDIVLLVDDQYPRNTWLKGIIDEIFMDKTGQVRRVNVRVASGKIFLRAVTQLAVLDVKPPANQEVNLCSKNSVNGGKDVENGS